MLDSCYQLIRVDLLDAHKICAYTEGGEGGWFISLMSQACSPLLCMQLAGKYAAFPLCTLHCLLMLQQLLDFQFYQRVMLFDTAL